jgi:hypothetical protein
VDDTSTECRHERFSDPLSEGRRSGPAFVGEYLISEAVRLFAKILFDEPFMKTRFRPARSGEHSIAVRILSSVRSHASFSASEGPLTAFASHVPQSLA